MAIKKAHIVPVLYKYKAHHVLFWICYFVFWVLVYDNFYLSINLLVSVVGVYLLFHALAFYGTAYWLVPGFLYQQKVFQFIALSMLVFSLCGIGICTGIFLLMGEKAGNFTNNWFYLWVITSFSTLAIAGILTAVKTVTERYRSQKKAEKIKKQNLETELKFLKAQVNPHFLFNVINSIYVLINKNPDKASHALLKLSQMMRLQLYEFSDDTIEIEREIRYLNNYIELEKLRKGDEVTVHLQTDGNMNGFAIAPFLLIPFLENAFKYVSAFKERENKIDVRLEQEDGTFQAFFSNTTENEIENPKHLKEGIGIQNAKRRLQLIYPDRHTLRINREQNRFNVTLTLNLS